MRTLNDLYFEEYLIGTSASSPMYTNADFNARFGQADQLTWQIIADNFAGSGTWNLVATLQHSSDGRNWAPKSGSTDATGAGTGVPSPANTPVVAIGSDQGATPSLHFVRLAVYFNISTITAHVKVYVTARDGRV